MNNEIINGVFDSGVGGLSVLKKLLPKGGKYIYFGDTKNLPYGDKSKEEIISFTRLIIEFFISKGAKRAFMACNTSSALAYDTLKSEFETKIKIYPLIQSAAPYIAKEGKKIAILATSGTVKSKMYSREILSANPNAEVIEQMAPGLVPIVENSLYNSIESLKYVESCIKPLLDFKCDKIVLGCTHYPYLMPLFTKFAPEEMFIDPSEYIANLIEKTNMPSHTEFYVSKDPEKFRKNAKIFMQINEPIYLFEKNLCYN